MNVLFFVILKSKRRMIVLTDISAYIKANKKLKQLDFMTVYLTIVELIKDGKIDV